MNCYDVSRLLDEREPAAFTPAERRALDVHAAGCPECARQRLASDAMAAFRHDLPPPLPAGLRERARALADVREGEGKERAALTRRPLIFGSLLLLGAAAATLAAFPRGETPVASQ